MFTVGITQSAEEDIRRITKWWETHRSKAQAVRWYEMIYDALKSLELMPRRCPIAPESDELGREIRHFLFGLSGKQTHRVLFAVHGSHVTVYRILHMAQHVMETEDELATTSTLS